MKVQIIADSISQDKIRLTTYHVRYWRAIHSELMTHRVFTRNARSSRAVPVSTLLSEDIFIPHFQLNQPGMQAVNELTRDQREEAEKVWRELADYTRSRVKRLQELGVHKQWANRPLEWFGWIDVLISSTDWTNFWALRIDKHAQPELRMLAQEMYKRMTLSVPELKISGDWHLPYINSKELSKYGLETCQKLSVARCARLSYRPFDGNDNLEAEMDRYEKLVVSRPVHASPAEHQATPDIAHVDKSGDFLRWHHGDQQGNFYGWRQYRKMLPYENVPDPHYNGRS